MADRSGCTPGSGSLPDGTWYGYVDAAVDGRLSFDLACFFSGRQAELAAGEDGEESPPPNDYYIRNTRSETRPLQVGAETPVTWYPDFGDPNSKEETTYVEWIAATADRSFDVGVWVEVEDGRVEVIAENWVP